VTTVYQQEHSLCSGCGHNTYDVQKILNKSAKHIWGKVLPVIHQNWWEKENKHR